MVQLTLTGTRKEEEVKVPIFIFNNGTGASELAELIVKVKPTYLLNISNNVESLKTYCKGNISKEIVFIMDSEAKTEVESDKGLLGKVKFIDLFNF